MGYLGADSANSRTEEAGWKGWAGYGTENEHGW